MDESSSLSSGCVALTGWLAGRCGMTNARCVRALISINFGLLVISVAFELMGLGTYIVGLSAYLRSDITLFLNLPN